MTTGLTVGTISATFGYTAGITSRAQFSVLVAVVVLSAVVPTAIAQRFFSPASPTVAEVAADAHGRLGERTGLIPDHLATWNHRR